MKKKRRSKKGFFAKNYSKSWSYIKESKKFIYIIIGAFLVFAFFGFFVPAPEYLTDQLMQLIQDLLDKTSGMNAEELTGFIFINNARSSFFGLVLGVFLGIFPIMNAILNGYVLGFVSLLSVQNAGFLSLWRLLPHGIIELTGVFISLGMGLRLGVLPFIKSKKRKNILKQKFETLKDNFIESLRVFVFVVIPLLIIAAIIEGILIASFS